MTKQTIVPLKHAALPSKQPMQKNQHQLKIRDSIRECFGMLRVATKKRKMFKNRLTIENAIGIIKPLGKRLRKC
ncbi:hypothetical protein JDW15_09270 [Aerococcaceae bacterium zg-ZJ1578]|uniref:hypothetical protein n=1 Tax=Aerococcaceae bacterium zg-252 TaxID=2796928 RepID=UPI001A28FDC9|nr:hypothetical protein [Aerococcaceae bacterium zg-1578]